MIGFAQARREINLRIGASFTRLQTLLLQVSQVMRLALWLRVEVELHDKGPRRAMVRDLQHLGFWGLGFRV